jgi:molybdopterin-containing oxidoreductase family iron-sulfur binding subunit
LEATTWSDADDAITKGLAAAANGGKRIVLLTNTVISPSIAAAVAELKARYATVEHVQYDTISYSGLTNANAKSFGKRAMPSYDLTKADVVVGVDADFLSSWGSTTELTWQYASRRNPKGAMSRHFQFEARMSLSGANADERTAIKPSDIPALVISLHDQVAKRTGGTTIGGGNAEMDVITARAAAALLVSVGSVAQAVESLLQDGLPDAALALAEAWQEAGGKGGSVGPLAEQCRRRFEQHVREVLKAL